MKKKMAKTRTSPLPRDAQCPLTKAQIYDFYNKVLIPFEIEEVDLSGYKAESPEIKTLKEKYHFDFGKNEQIKTDEDAAINTFYLKSYHSYSLPASLWARVRDAFSHNRIYQNSSQEFVIEDVHNGRLTMYARVSSIENVVNFIDEIRSLKQHNNNENEKE